MALFWIAEDLAKVNMINKGRSMESNIRYTLQGAFKEISSFLPQYKKKNKISSFLPKLDLLTVLEFD